MKKMNWKKIRCRVSHNFKEIKWQKNKSIHSWIRLTEECKRCGKIRLSSNFTEMADEYLYNDDYWSDFNLTDNIVGG